MKQTTIIAALLVAFVSFACTLHAQGAHRMDSLQRVVAGNTAPDSSKAMAYVELSLLFRLSGEPDSALVMARNGYDVAHKAGFARGEAKSLYYIGVVHATRGNYNAAEEYYNRAGHIFDSIGDRKNYSSVLTAIGGVYQYKGDPTTALEYHTKSLKIKKEIGDSLVAASVMMNIGSTYSTIGKPAEALKYYMEAYGIHLRAHDMDKLSDDCSNIGNMYHQLGQDSLGMLYLRRSIALADSLELVEILSYSYGAMAGIYYDNAQYDSAEYCYNQALEAAMSLDDKRMMSYQYMNLAGVYDAKGNTAQAEASLQQALKVASEVHALEAIRDIYSTAGKFYRSHGRFEEALDAYEHYVDYRDSILDVEKSAEFARQEMTLKYDSERAIEQAEQDKKDAITNAEIRQQYILMVAGAVLLLFAVILAVVLYNRAKITRQQNMLIQQQKEEVERQRDQVELQKAEIEEKNKNITDSITYARRIQQAILPDAKLLAQLLPQSFVFYRPKDIVSGDFYWVAETADYIFYATVDCTGHGVPGGFMSVLGASLLNEIVSERGVVSPSEILNLMRDKIVSALHQTGESGENKDGMDMSICRLNRSRSELHFAAANNGVWLVRNGELIEYKADKQPVGIGATEPKPFTTQTIVLQQNDMVYTFTDGFADQFGGDRGKKYKYSQLKSFLISCASDLPEVQLQKMSAEFESWRGEAEQIDDVLVIGVRV